MCQQADSLGRGMGRVLCMKTPRKVLATAAVVVGTAAIGVPAAEAAPPYPGTLPCGTSRTYDQWIYLYNCNTWNRSATVEGGGYKYYVCVDAGDVLVLDRGGAPRVYFQGVFGPVAC